MKQYKIKRLTNELDKDRSAQLKIWMENWSLRVTTHNGEFHCDELAAVALLNFVMTEKYNSPIIVDRTRQLDEAFNNYHLIVDVGGGYFDHHGSAKNDNGNFAIISDEDGNEIEIPHCGATLVATALEDLGLINIGPALERELVAIAAQDNGVMIDMTPKISFVQEFNTLWDEDRKDQDDHFNFALKMACSVIERIMMVDASSKKEASLLDGLPLNKEIVELPCPGLSWIKVLARPESIAKLVIFHGDNDTWFIQCVPPSIKEWTQKRIPLPESWTKRPRNEGDFVFCHVGRFIAGFKTRESALAAAEEALNQ